MNLTNIQFYYKMEVAFIVITTLCTVLLLQILYRLRTALPWRVNCWFCNTNTWVKYPENNSWTCPKCEQYNGFTKDGDYNKTITFANEQVSTTPKLFQKSSPQNGLCKMCNINQQLKVTQLANFVPMNEKSFDEEIEGYRMQLEKAYKLCTPCRRVVQIKLHKEKETLLSSKLLETRSPQKNQKRIKQAMALGNLLNNISNIIAAMLFILVSYELYEIMMAHENMSKTITHTIETFKGLFDRLITILTMKFYMTFPSLETQINELYDTHYFDLLPKGFRLQTFEYFNMTTQDVLGVFACFIQIIANIWNVNSLRYTIACDVLWIIFVLSNANSFANLLPVTTTLIKLASVSMLIIVYKTNRKPIKVLSKRAASPKPMRKLTGLSTSDPAETMEIDSEDDISLSKFGLHNFSESSNETINLSNTSLINGRSFTPRSDSLWSKPKLNSTFCVNSAIGSPPPETFAKPSFNTYQEKYDSDSDLDESISCLSLGPVKARSGTGSVFSLRRFTASPRVAAPATRPLISPSKLGNGTSWVAGGYWGDSAPPPEGSRSSSQSSGFESQASAPRRDPSFCTESMPFERASSFQPVNSFSRVSTPVFPQMQYNGHVHIPQTRYPPHVPLPPHTPLPPYTPLPPHTSLPPYPPHPRYAQIDPFKIPGASGLIKLPRINQFTSH